MNRLAFNVNTIYFGLYTERLTVTEVIC